MCFVVVIKAFVCYIWRLKTVYYYVRNPVQAVLHILIYRELQNIDLDFYPRGPLYLWEVPVRLTGLVSRTKEITKPK